MKATPENRIAMERIAETARIKNTGYQIRIYDDCDRNDEGYISMQISRPKNTDTAVYPEIFYKDDWYGDHEVGFEIATTGYGDHSLAQAHRALAGLQIAIDLVEAMLTTAELYGLKIRR